MTGSPIMLIAGGSGSIGIDAVVDCVAAGPDSGRISGAFSETDPAAYTQLMALPAVYLQRLAATMPGT